MPTSYSIDAVGSLTLSGISSQKVSTSSDAVGGSVFSGIASQRISGAYLATGGIVLTGVAQTLKGNIFVPSGGISITGIASGITSASINTLGTVILTGLSSYSNSYITSSTGNIILTGVARTSQTSIYSTGTVGGLTFTGLASYTTGAVVLATNGLIFTSLAANTSVSYYSKSQSGSLTSNGNTTEYVTYIYNAFGRIAVSGVTPAHGYGAVVFTGLILAKVTVLTSAEGAQFITGPAEVKANYIVDSSDITLVSGRASVTKIDNVIGIGNIKFRGIADVVMLPSVYGTVRAVLSGQAGRVIDVFVISNYEGNVTSQIGGVAEVNFIPELEGNLHARLRGTAEEVTLIPNLQGNLNAFLKGQASVSFLGAYEANGRLRIRGSAFSYVQADLDYDPDGGLGLSSSPINPISSVYEYESNGSSVFNGYAIRIKTSLKGVTFTDGVGLTGTCGIVVLGFAPPIGGTLNVSGQAGLSSSSYEYFPDNGIINFTGLANTTQNFYVNVGGALYVSSNFNNISSTVNTDGSTSFGLGGSASISIRDKFKKTFAWRIRQVVSFKKTFSWGVGERPFSFYRVSGKCKPAYCPPIQVNGCQPDSKFTYVVNIYARNLAEVCRKLRERNMIFPIATIEKFSTPASTIDYTDSTDTTCNKLLDVTPPITFLPCQDLLVDFNASANIGVSMTAAIVVGQYNGSGRLGLTGGVYPFDYRIYEPFGALGISGIATCVQKNYKYEAYGSIGIGGAVEHITLPVWVYSASGNLTAVVSGDPIRVVHTNWSMEASGGLGVTGVWDSMPAMVWKMSGQISTLNSTALGAENFLPYVLDMTGFIGFSNETDGSRGEYVYEAFGAINFTGLTHFLTPHITIQPSGRLRMSNGDGTVPQSSSNLGIAAYFNGTASVMFTPEYGQAGSIGLSGQADVNSSVIEPIGSVTIGGNALVNCSDLGEVAMIFAFEFSVKNETVLFAYDDAPTAVIPAKRITTQCCTKSLPLRLWVQHPLASANHFSHFLQRNNLLIDNPVQIYYNQTEKAWYNTIHFEGFAPDFPTIESWSITFGWLCSDNMTTDLILDSSNLYYRFSMMVTLRSVNNPTIPHRVSKIVVGFDPTRACFNNKTFTFPFTFDTTAKTTNPTAVQTLVYVDDIGLFKTLDFLKSPEIRFKVSEIVADIPQTVIDIGPALTGSQRLGSNFNGNILSSLPTG